MRLFGPDRIARLFVERRDQFDSENSQEVGPIVPSRTRVMPIRASGAPRSRFEGNVFSPVEP